MGFHDVALLPSRAIFSSPHFLIIVVVMKASGPPHVLKLVGGKQGHAPCKIILLQQSLFLYHLNFMEIIRLL